jgi:alanyl-tRNA synthetase
MGAMALFGEKYGDAVRVIVFDPKYSVELCGGTHVANTAEIRYFKIVSEASSAAGIRRIEAYTSDRALAYLNAQVDNLNRIGDLLKNPKDVVKAVEELANRNRDLEKEVERFNQEKVNGLQNELRNRIKSLNGLNLLNEVVEIPSAKDLQALAFNLRNVLDNTVVVLGAVIDEKPLLNVILTKDLEASGKFHAADLVRKLATEIQGGGGGQAFFASAGGKNAAGIAKAVKKAEELV